MSNICVLTTYFNYYQNPFLLDNYNKFKQAIAEEKVPLLTVEAVLEGESSVLEGDDVLRVKSSSILWQKERMINLAIEHLSGQYKYIAWVDCDVLLVPGWSSEAKKLLNLCNVVQLFSKINFFNPWGHVENVLDSVAFSLVNNKGSENFKIPCVCGGAWITHVDILQDIGIYDACVSSGNDILFAASVCGSEKEVLFLNEAMNSHYFEWADEIKLRHRCRVNYVKAVCGHMYHGNVNNHYYQKRNEILKKWGFNPYFDIVKNEDKLYEWSTNNIEVKRAIKIMMKHRHSQNVKIG